MSDGAGEDEIREAMRELEKISRKRREIVKLIGALFPCNVGYQCWQMCLVVKNCILGT